MKYPHIFVALWLVTNSALANNLIDGTMVQILAERGNTGCNQFHYVTDADLHAAQQGSESIESNNIQVEQKPRCITAVKAELHGSYNANNISLFNIQADNSEEIFLDIEGSADLSANNIDFGNIDATGVADINSDISLGSVQLNDANSIAVGNIHVRDTPEPRSVLSIHSQLGIANVDTSLGNLEAGNVVIDKQVLSQTKVLTIKQDISIESSR